MSQLLHRAQRLTAALLLTALTSAGVAGEAQAYTFTQTCSDGSGATWQSNQLPLPYYIQSAGSADMSFAKVQTILGDSFNAWSEPCCSSFEAQYAGTTQTTALQTQNQVILSWEEQSWPSQLGDARGTIAVTLLSYTRSCTIYNAPIVFNGVGFQFTDQCNASGCAGGGTDLQGVATHEIGHLLGLDHSQVQDATMFYAYTGGSNARSLHTDDTQGVCALYPRQCTCQTAADCTGDREQCVGGQCVRVPCQSDNECDTGLACDRASGDCIVPPCGSDAECGDGFVCRDTKCVSSCPVCRDCTETAQCGANAVCADLNGDAAGECIVFCEQDGSCPGDGACFQLDTQDGTYYLCLNQDANTAGACPDNYVCEDACEGVTCNAGQQCVNGTCITPDPCAGVSCPSGFSCNNGTCTEDNPCARVTCDADERCQNGLCVPLDPCANIDCPSGYSCQAGQCVLNETQPDMSMTPVDMGTSGMEEEDVVIFPSNPAPADDLACVCAAVDTPTAPNAGLLWIVLGMFGVGLRRRTARRAA